LGVPVATLGNWKRRRAAAGLAAPEAAAASAPGLPIRWPVSELEAECSRLRRELADAKLDVEILRKAGRRTLQGDRDGVR
jgi:transposase